MVGAVKCYEQGLFVNGDKPEVNLGVSIRGTGSYVLGS